MYYAVSSDQLTAIADVIRAKALIQSRGKNLLNPIRMAAKLPAGTYTASVKVKWDGVADGAGQISASDYFVFFPVYDDPIESGTVTIETVSFTLSAERIVHMYLTSGIETSEMMIETGDTKTEYEPFQPVLLEFPDDFKDEIDSISTLEEETANANARAEHIIYNKTAYVKGVKLTGTFKPVLKTVNAVKSFENDTQATRSISAGDSKNYYATVAVPNDVMTLPASILYAHGTVTRSNVPLGVGVSFSGLNELITVANGTIKVLVQVDNDTDENVILPTDMVLTIPVKYYSA